MASCEQFPIVMSDDHCERWKDAVALVLLVLANVTSQHAPQHTTHFNTIIQPTATRSLIPILWSLTFASVNSFKIYQILVERKANVNLPKDQLDVYRRQFEPHGITPKQFEYIMKKAEIIRLKKGEVLIREGDPLRHVFLITTGHTRAHHLGRRLTAVSYAHEPMKDEPNVPNPSPATGASGAWVGEMAFFEMAWSQGDGKNKSEKKQETDDEAVPSGAEGEGVQAPKAPSPTERAMYTIVALEDNTTVFAWTHADMEALMKKSIDMRTALTRAMTAAIVSKVVGFTISRKSSGGGAAAWIGRLWPGATQGPVEPSGSTVEPVVDGPHKVPLPLRPVFAVPESKP
eukprot:scaffold8204_cov177-Amphora_coffeaeformis.AAC.9